MKSKWTEFVSIDTKGNRVSYDQLLHFYKVNLCLNVAAWGCNNKRALKRINVCYIQKYLVVLFSVNAKCTDP